LSLRRESTPPTTKQLQCGECGRVSRENERGWKAYLGDADDGGDELLVFCPGCAEREFGNGWHVSRQIDAE
jgi:hypothetical protein